MNSKEQSIKRQLQCTNCGTEIKQLTPSKVKKPGEPVAEELEEITCPVCNYRFVAGVEETEAPLLSREDFENKLRQLIWAANQGGMKGRDIIESLRQELEFTVECAEPGFHYTVQIINLGQENSMKAPAPRVEDYRERLAKHNFNQS
ncbi:MAG: hypothetical protein J0I20_25700 [Chloroflexi bacterium]|nr:hypothetical protein [Chloroflexota bacterium]OJW01827.1 MAG: hypothetical protein BGO39_28155 [Chloroflexi bacterium 54-19]